MPGGLVPVPGPRHNLLPECHRRPCWTLRDHLLNASDLGLGAISADLIAIILTYALQSDLLHDSERACIGMSGPPSRMPSLTCGFTCCSSNGVWPRRGHQKQQASACQVAEIPSSSTSRGLVYRCVYLVQSFTAGLGPFHSQGRTGDPEVRFQIGCTVKAVIRGCILSHCIDMLS